MVYAYIYICLEGLLLHLRGEQHCGKGLGRGGGGVVRPALFGEEYIYFY